MVFSRYRTARGQELLVLTFLNCKETYLFCPPPPVVINPLVDFAPFWESQAREPEAKGPPADAS